MSKNSAQRPVNLGNEIEDLHSIETDFNLAIEYAEKLLNNRYKDDTVNRALWDAAAIAYRRPFSSGRSPKHEGGNRHAVAKSWAEELNPSQASIHAEVMNWANKQVAHRVWSKEKYEHSHQSKNSLYHEVEVVPQFSHVQSLVDLSIHFATKAGADRHRMRIELQQSIDLAESSRSQQ